MQADFLFEIEDGENTSEQVERRAYIKGLKTYYLLSPTSFDASPAFFTFRPGMEGM